MRQAHLVSGTAPAATRAPARRSRAVTLAATALVICGMLLAVASIPLYAVTRQNWLVNGGENIVVGLIFAVVGITVVRHQPRNPIGWIMLIAAIGSEPLPTDAASYALLVYRLGHGLPFGALAVLLQYTWAVTAPLLLLIILLFPDGRLPSPRWRPVLWSYLGVVAALAGCLYAVAGAALAGHHARIDSGGGLQVIDLPRGGYAWLAVFERLVLLVFAGFWVSFVVAQVLSWRRSSGERRQQLKWLMSGAAVLAASQAIIQPALNLDPRLPASAQLALDVLLGLGAAALPVSVAFAILRYRLYDIDRIISRTLAYAIVTGILVGVYAGLVLLAQQVLRFSSPVAVAASTLGAAALFNPVRRRVQQAVDRRFNRARYDAGQTIEAFAAHVKDATDLDSVRADLAAAVTRALEPVHVSVWIRP